MTTRVEKLAWELIGVLSNYKPKEIDEAIALIEEGKLLEKPTLLLKKISKNRGDPSSHKHLRSRAPLAEDQLPLGNDSSAPRKPYEAFQLLDPSDVIAKPELTGPREASDTNTRTEQARINFLNLSSDEQNILKDLAEGISSGLYLKTSSLLKEFASRLNIALTKKLPSRSVLTLSIIEEILLLEREQMKQFVEAAKSMSEDVSSLQEWSKLIVR